MHLKKDLDEVFKRMLAQKVDNWRARLIRNSLERSPNDAKFFHQDIYVPMERVSPLPSCVTAPICPVMQSVSVIPTPVRFGTSLFDFVGSVDGSVAFKEAGIGMDDFMKAGKYSKSLTLFKYTLKKIQVDHPNIPYIRVRAIFNSPQDVMIFNCASNGDCDYWNMEYPVTGDVLQMIVQAILQEFNPPVGPVNKQIEVNAQNQEHAPDGR